jgi:hypothetical protein
LPETGQSLATAATPGVDAPYEVEVSTGEWNFVVTCANCRGRTGVVSLLREEAASRLGLILGHQRTIDETSG